MPPNNNLEKFNILFEYRDYYSKISGIQFYDDLDEKLNLCFSEAQKTDIISSELEREIESIIRINFRRVIKSRCEGLNKSLRNRNFKRVKIHDIKKKIQNCCYNGETDLDFFEYFNLLSEIRDIEEEVSELKFIEKNNLKLNIGFMIIGFVLGIVASVVGTLILNLF